MTEAGSTNPKSLDAQLLEFDQQWNIDVAGRIETWLEQVLPQDREEGLLECIKIDLQNCSMQGRPQRFEHYLVLYPQLASSESVRDELLEEEMIARRRSGETLGDAELESRFGSQASLVRQKWESVCARYRTASSTRRGKRSGNGGHLASSLQGILVQDRYETRERIGQGAHADVYLAWDRMLGREVALKVTRQGVEEGSETASRFFREAESIAQLQHPGIVSVFEFGRHGEQLFIVEEYVSDGTLEPRLNDGPIPPDQAVGWLREICAAVEYAHQCGVIHRDLKPANVLVDRHGRMRVGDFGIASRRDGEQRLTLEGDLLGTPAYMSPEQVRGTTDIGPASDVHALGAILYQMLTGVLPFQGSTATVLNQILKSEPVRPRRLNPRIPAELETVCLKAMAREPDRRYQSAQDLAEDLRRAIECEPLRARRTSWIGLGRLWVRRQPALSAVVIASVLVIGVVLVASFLRVTEERNRFRGERDRANVALFQSLKANVENELRVKEAGWHERSIQLLETATSVPALDADRSGLRDLAAEVLIDPAQRFELRNRIESESCLPDGKTASPIVAISMDAASDPVVASGDSTGNVWLHFPDRNQSFRVAELESPIRDLHLDLGHGRLFGLCDLQLVCWALPELKGDVERLPELENGLPVGGPGVTAFCVDAAGKQLACGYETGEIELYKIEGEKFRRQYAWSAHDGFVVDLEFSADGLLVASSSDDQFLRCWETGTATLMFGYLAANAPRSICFGTADASLHWTMWETFALYALPFGGTVHVFGAWTGAFRQVREIGLREYVTISTGGQTSLWKNERVVAEAGGQGEPVCMSVPAGNKLVAVGYANGRVCIWKLATSQISQRFATRHAIDLDDQGRVVDDMGQLDEHDPSRHLSLFQTNTTVAMAVGHREDLVVAANQQCQLIVLRNGAVRTIEHCSSRPARSLAIGNHDQWIVACDPEGPLRIWDATTLNLYREIPLELGEILRVAAEPEGERILVAGRSGTVLVNPQGETQALTPHVQFDCAVAFSDSALAFSHADGRLEIVSNDPTQEPVVILSQKQGVRDAVFSADGKSLFCLYANHDIASWDWKQNRLVQKISPDLLSLRLVVDPLGKYLLMLTPWDKARVLDAGTLKSLAQVSNLKSIAGFSPDGKTLYHALNGILEIDRSLLDDRKRRDGLLGEQDSVIEAGFHQVVPGGHLDTVWSVDVSPDGKWTATSSFDEKVKVWDNASGRMTANMELHHGMIWRVRFSPDSESVASASVDADQEQGEIILWRRDSMEETGRLLLGTRLIGGMDFHPERPWLAASGFDGTVGIADTNSYQWVATAQPFRQPIMDVQFSRCGRFLAAACLGNGLALWTVVDENGNESLPLINPELFVEPNERVWAVAFSHDQRILAAGCESGSVIFYDLASRKKIVSLRTGCPRLRYLRFAPDDSRLWCSAYVGEGCAIDLHDLVGELDRFGLAW